MLKTWSTNAEIPGQEVIRNPKHHIGSNVCMQYVCIFFFGLAFIRLYQNCSLTNLTFNLCSTSTQPENIKKLVFSYFQ